MKKIFLTVITVVCASLCFTLPALAADDVAVSTLRDEQVEIYKYNINTFGVDVNSLKLSSLGEKERILFESSDNRHTFRAFATIDENNNFAIYCGSSSVFSFDWKKATYKINNNDYVSDFRNKSFNSSQLILVNNHIEYYINGLSFGLGDNIVDSCNIPVYRVQSSFNAYSNTLDGTVLDFVPDSMREFDTDEELYLKNIQWQTVSTGGSGKENCYCFMQWDTSNITENDFINIRSDLWYQHYILGDKVSGSYDICEMKKTDSFESQTWSSFYSYDLDLQGGSLCFNYLVFPMLYGNSRESIDNIYNGGVNSIYLQLVRFYPETNQYKQGLWVKVDFEESSVSYPDVSKITAGTVDKATGGFSVNPDSDYGLEGYGINGETGHIRPVGELGSLDSVDEIGEYVFAQLKNITSQLGSFPSMIAKIFSFLPNEIFILIGCGLVIAVLLRILGR